jgi:hypothetical protein
MSIIVYNITGTGAPAVADVCELPGACLALLASPGLVIMARLDASLNERAVEAS